MRYVPWVSKVFHALGDASRGTMGGGAGLGPVGDVLDFPGLTDKEFTADRGPGRSLMTAMYDLDEADYVDFKNVGYGNVVTPAGRDFLESGLESDWPSIHEISVSAGERTFLARLYAAAIEEDDGWADLRFVDADAIYAECGFPTVEYADAIARLEFYQHLERKRLVRPESRALGTASMYRPTYLSAVIVTEADPRHGGPRAGLIDWSIPTPGFEAVEATLTDLKVKLDGAVTDADLSDIGLRCRRLLVDIMKVVYRPEMVPAGTKPPSPEHADGMLAVYLVARLRGEDNEEYRKFLKGAWALAGARVHSDRSGRASAVAAAQGALSFLRAIEAIERVSRD